MNVTDITATIDRSRESDPDWDFSIDARDAWITAAAEAGVKIDGESHEPAEFGSYDSFATRVRVAGEWYTIEVCNRDDVRAKLDG